VRETERVGWHLASDLGCYPGGGFHGGWVGTGTNYSDSFNQFDPARTRHLIAIDSIR